MPLDSRSFSVFRAFTLFTVLSLSVFCMIMIAPAPSTSDPAFPRIEYAASTDGVTFRAEPGQQSKKLAVIPFGEPVKVLSVKGDELFLAGSFGRWTEMEWKGKKGWSFGGLLTPHNPDTLKKTAREKIFAQYPVRTDLPPDKAEKGIVVVSKILGDFAVVERDRFDTEDEKLIYIPYLMRYLGGAWVLMEELTVHDMRGGVMKLFHLDNDRYPDICTAQGCCDNWSVLFFRSDKNGKVSRLADFDLGSYRCESSDVKTGRCGETIVTCVSMSGKKEIHAYDCAKNAFVKK